MSIYAVVGRFLFGLLASALSASQIGSKGCPFGLVGYLVIWFTLRGLSTV
jgi:hypothetical protein